MSGGGSVVVVLVVVVLVVVVVVLVLVVVVLVVVGLVLGVEELVVLVVVVGLAVEWRTDSTGALDGCCRPATGTTTSRPVVPHPVATTATAIAIAQAIAQAARRCGPVTDALAGPRLKITQESYSQPVGCWSHP